MAAAATLEDGLDHAHHHHTHTHTHIRSRAATRAPIRPLETTDRERLAEAFLRLSEETRRRRFGTVAKRLSERDLERLTNIDHHHHEALAAFAPGTGQIVGVARYIALPDDLSVAEIAVVVEDQWQSLGIGRRLMRDLMGWARAEGITRLLAYVSADNRPMRGWIARAGGVAEVNDGDAALYGVPLDYFADERRAA